MLNAIEGYLVFGYADGGDASDQQLHHFGDAPHICGFFIIFSDMIAIEKVFFINASIKMIYLFPVG